MDLCHQLHLVGLMVRASASRAADSRFLCGDFSGLSHTSD